MSLLDRLNLLIRSELSDLTRSENRGTVREMQESLRDARRQQVAVRRGEKDLIRQIREARADADRWEERAVLALKSSDEELAREALIMKNRVLAESQRLREELEQQRVYARDIERALEALEMKLEGARSRVRGISRSSVDRREGTSEAEWDRRLRDRMKEGPDTSASGGSTPSFETERSFREFDRMSDKIHSMEADVDAARELSGDDWADPRRRELESIFTKMERKKKSDDDLSDLKKKFSD